MSIPDVITLTRELIALDTVNPPGNEAVAATLIGNLLAENGFEVDSISYGENRRHVVARKNGRGTGLPVVFTGHFDTVPLGAKQWKTDPFGGEIKDGKLYGRGSTDMKGGVAAMVIAAIRAFEEGNPGAGVRLVLPAGEETGCQGAKHLVATYKKLGQTWGIIVGEPTANTSHRKVLERIKKELGEEVAIEILVDLQAVSTRESEPFVQSVYAACGIQPGDADYPKSLPYLTDGAVLQPAYGNAPTIILGSGQPEMAHQTDEFCYVSKIEQSVDIYKNIIFKGGI